MKLKDDDFKRNFFLFAIAKVISVLIGLYLVHTNASTPILTFFIIINVVEIIVLLYTVREFWLIAWVSISLINPTNYLLHVVALTPVYMFSVYFAPRIAVIAILFAPLALYKMGWREQFKLRGWLIIMLGCILVIRSYCRFLPENLLKYTNCSKTS